MKTKPEVQGAATGLVIVFVILIAAGVSTEETVEILLITAALVALVFLLIEWIVK